LSSTAFVLQMLGERGEMATKHGKAAFAVLLMQDIAIVPLLAMVPVLADAPVMMDEQPLWLETLVVLGLIAGVLAVGRYVIPWVLAKTAQSRNMEAFGIVTMLAALGAAYVMELVGVSMALGAFLVGMMLSASDYRHQIEASVEPFKGLMLALFFISVGMSIDLGLLLNNWAEVAKSVVALLILKIVTLFVLGLIFGLGRGAAVRTAFILSQCGEFGFVLFGAAHAAGLLTAEMFAIALSLITVTMILTPLMTKLGDLLAVRAGGTPGAAAAAEHERVQLERHVVVAGYGRGGRVVCLMLENSGIPFVAFDTDPHRVFLGKREGHNVRFGDMTDPHVIDSAGVGDAVALVVTLYDTHQAERLVSTVRNFYPGIPVYARVRNLTVRDAMLAQGVSHAVPEAAEGRLQLGKAVLQGVGKAETDIRTLLEDLRREDYAMLRFRT
jgi:glutathione-regulated potassium-efflux system protein KefB